jgi:hypothetical protein
MKDKLPFEQSFNDGLRVYAKRWVLWLLWVIVCLSPLAIFWMVR